MSLSKNSITPQNLLAAAKSTDYYLVETSGNQARFRIEPLQKGFGLTIGNAMRRTLLSSICGAAVIGVCIEGVEHEYSTIEGIEEDVMEILLNLKSLVIASDDDRKKMLSLRIENLNKPTIITADMISLPEGVYIMNRNAIICNIQKPGVRLKMDIYVGVGSGYITSEKNGKKLPLHLDGSNVIAIDSIFSPVMRVAYNVETHAVADEEYERLFLTIETNGSMPPDMAMFMSARILQGQLHPLVGATVETNQPESTKPTLTFDHKLLMRVENLELSVRSYNCLKNENIVYVGDLVTKTEGEMLRTPNFGRKSLNEMKEILAKMNLHFGMEINGWPPECNVDELAKKYEEEM